MAAGQKSGTAGAASALAAAAARLGAAPLRLRGQAGDAAAVAGDLADDGRNTRANTWNGALGAVSLNLYNPFIGIDLIRLGGTAMEVGLLSALPPLAAVLTNVAGARWLAARREPQRAGAAMFALARLSLLGLALLNLGMRSGAPPSSGDWRAGALVAVLGLLNLPGAVGLLAWQALLPSFLSPRRRASALALRGTAASLAGVATALGAGWWARSRTGLDAYAWLYAAAAVVGLAETAAFLWLRGRARAEGHGSEAGREAAASLRGAVQPGALLAAARRFWGIAPFRAYTLACLPFYLGWLMAWPLFLDYQVNVAHASNLWMGAFIAVNSLAAAVGNAAWHRIGDRLGARLTLPAACLALAAVPLQYIWAPGLWGIFVNQVVGGLCGAGATLFMLVRLLEVAPADDRMVAMGLANTAIGVVSVAGPLLGMALLGVLPMPGTFWIPTVLRFGGGLCLLAVALPARRARPA